MLVYAIVLTTVTLMSWMASEVVRLRGQMHHVLKILSAQRLPPVSRSTTTQQPLNTPQHSDSGAGVGVASSAMSGFAATLLRTAMPVIPERARDAAARVEEISDADVPATTPTARAPEEGDAPLAIPAPDDGAPEA